MVHLLFGKMIAYTNRTCGVAGDNFSVILPSSGTLVVLVLTMTDSALLVRELIERTVALQYYPYAPYIYGIRFCVIERLSLCPAGSRKPGL